MYWGYITPTRLIKLKKSAINLWVYYNNILQRDVWMETDVKQFQKRNKQFKIHIQRGKHTVFDLWQVKNLNICIEVNLK